MLLPRLLVRGPFRGPTGHDHHVREFVRELNRQGVAVQLVDGPEWGPARLAPEQQDPWFDSLDRDVVATVALHFTMPHQVIPYAGLVNVNYTMFEATRVHPSWIGHSSRHDLVIVPTESSRRAWLDSGLDPGKIRVSPLGIDPERFGGTVVPRPIKTADGEPIAHHAVRFLNISELSPRKNQVGLLRTWLRATTRHDDAILLLKLGLYSPGWQAEWNRAVARLQAEVGKGLDQAAPLQTLHAVLADHEMPGLYAAATHYVSLSNGEGWDQPMVEAVASGLRLIAPDHSAYQAYLDRFSATLIPTAEVPARFPGGGFTGELFKHASWWATDEAAAEAAIRAAIDGRDAPLHSARERVLRELTWERATRRLIALLDDVQRHQRYCRVRQPGGAPPPWPEAQCSAKSRSRS